MNQSEEFNSRCEEEEEERYLWLLLRTVWKNIWIILFTASMFGIGTYIGTKLLVTPTYQACFDAYVNNRNASESVTTITSTDISASQSLGNTYAEIITSRSVLNAAAKKLKIERPYDELQKIVTAEASYETGIITVSVIMEDPNQTVEMAKAVADVSKDYVARIVEGSSMQIIDEPITPNWIYGPNYKKRVLIGFLVGILITMIFVILREILDNRIKDQEELEKRFGIPIVGVIPSSAALKKHLVSYAYDAKFRGRS